MRWRLVALISAACGLAAVPAGASAAIKAKVSISTTSAGASRLSVALTSTTRLSASKRPRAVRVVAGGRTYRLTKAKAAAAAAASLGRWRSRAYTGAAAQRVRALAGITVRVRITSLSGSSTLSAKVPAGAPAGGGPTPAAPAPAPGSAPAAPGDGPPFNPPSSDVTGNEAYERIKGYFADARFTDCVPGWPNCSVEHRYSHFADGSQYYCRLTSSSGSDIRSYGEIDQITGAEQKTDGSWGVEYRLRSYGNVVFYSWSVAADGTVTGRYWGPGQDPSTGPPSELISGLVWARGAKDCSY